MSAGESAQFPATQVLAALLLGLGLHILLVCLALALVLLLRRSLGAQATCLVWSAVPAAALDAVLPSPARWHPPRPWPPCWC